jgi:MOSC domain-containing protein YiiM
LGIIKKESRYCPVEIISVNIGKPISLYYNGKELFTGIYKSPVNVPLYVTAVNLEGDGQADLEVHGGVDKALCIYCEEHYPYWGSNLNLEMEYGAFGENLTVRGMLETEVFIGDTYRLGEAIVQVSQPRQPCHKLAMRHDLTDLPVKVIATGYSGYYFRVLKEGLFPERRSIELVSKHPAGISIAYANKIRFHDKSNIEGIKRILAVEGLSASWRESFKRRLQELEN